MPKIEIPEENIRAAEQELRILDEVHRRLGRRPEVAAALKRRKQRRKDCKDERTALRDRIDARKKALPPLKSALTDRLRDLRAAEKSLRSQGAG